MDRLTAGCVGDMRCVASSTCALSGHSFESKKLHILKIRSLNDNIRLLLLFCVTSTCALDIRSMDIEALLHTQDNFSCVDPNRSSTGRSMYWTTTLRRDGPQEVFLHTDTKGHRPERVFMQEERQVCTVQVASA